VRREKTREDERRREKKREEERRREKKTPSLVLTFRHA